MTDEIIQSQLNNLSSVVGVISNELLAKFLIELANDISEG